MKRVALLLFVFTVAHAQEPPPQQPPPGPYVTVYHDDAVAFQVRRDRITPLAEGTYNVWLRWLWAEALPWKGDAEVARVIVSDIDCKGFRVRERKVLHKNREGKVYDTEEIPEEETRWKTFDPKSGAAAAMARLCEFVPQLLADKKP